MIRCTYAKEDSDINKNSIQVGGCFVNIETIISNATNEFKKQLESELSGLPEGQLTPAKASQFTQSMQKAISAAANKGYENFLQSHEHQEGTIIANGKILRFKQDSPKIF